VRPAVPVRRVRVLLAAALAVPACAGSGPAAKPAATAGSVDVQYEGGAPAPAAAAKPGIGLEFWAGRKDLITAPPPPKPAELTLPKVERFSLKNGLEVIVVPRKELPLATFSLSIEAGGYDESRDVLGVSDFVAAMLRRGT
jgi:hypothetical protein